MKESVDRKGRFLWRVVASHVLAYSLAGIFAVVVMNYGHLYSVPPLSCFMRPLDAPIVALGPVLQIVRGAIIACILWFFRKPLLEGKFGFLKIALLVFGLSYVSTVGPSLGSFEAAIYTTFPLEFFLIWLPETFIYTALFAVFLFFWYKIEKKVLTIVSIIVVVLLAAANILTFLSALEVFG